MLTINPRFEQVKIILTNKQSIGVILLNVLGCGGRSYSSETYNQNTKKMEVFLDNVRAMEGLCR